MRLVGVALGVAIAACFDKPPRPEGDGGPTGGACEQENPLALFGSGSGGSACGSGSATGGSQIIVNNQLQMNTTTSTGTVSCAWASVPVNAGIGISASQVLAMRNTDYTFFYVQSAMGTCSITAFAMGDIDAADQTGTTNTTTPSAGQMFLRMRPVGTTFVTEYSPNNQQWTQIGPCDFGAIPPALTLTVGIHFEANTGPSDRAVFSKIWGCQ